MMTNLQAPSTRIFISEFFPPAAPAVETGPSQSNITSSGVDARPPCLSVLLKEKIVVTVVIESVLMVAILFGNFLVALVVIKTPRLRTHANMFILSLTASDFLTGVSIAVILGTIAFPAPSDHAYTCSLRHSVLMVAWMGSLHSILAITVDRFIAILWPLSYPSIVTRVRVTVALAALWTYSVLVSASAFWFPETLQHPSPICDLILNLQPKYQIYCIANSIVVIVVICCLYLKIVLVARGQAARQSAMASHMAAARGERRKWWQVLRDKKYIRTAVLVFGVIALFSLPVVIVLSVQVIHGRGATEGMQTARLITSFLSQSASVLNPLIYIWRNDDFSRALKRCCGISDTPKSSVASSELTTPSVISASSSTVGIGSESGPADHK